MPLEVTQLELGPFPVNCYVVSPPESEEAVVVDPGWPGEVDRIRAELDRRGARCVGILITHGDYDHLGGVAELAEATGAPVHMAEAERDRLERLAELVPPDWGTARSYTPDVLLAGDERLELAEITFQTMRVPGHTSGHLAYAAEGCVFSGDVLFAGSVGRTDRPGNDYGQLLDSIRLLAERLPPETIVYAGHGPPTTLGRELETNPFLRELRAASR